MGIRGEPRWASMEKLGLRTRAPLVRYALQKGLRKEG